MKVYVQDLMRKDSEKLSKLLLEKAAKFYICGYAKNSSSDLVTISLGLSRSTQTR